MIRIENRRKYKGDGEYVGRAVARAGIKKGSPLASQFALKGQADDSERRALIFRYATWLDEQLGDPDSPQNQELERLCQLYRDSGELTLICWCAPKPCHAQIIRAKILERVGQA